MTTAAARHFRAELVRCRPLSSNVRSLVFRVTEQPPLAWHPGQYVEIELGPGLKKPFSIASAMGAHGQGELEIAVSRGSNTDAFDALEPGAWLSVHGPAGELKRSRAGSPAVFIAAGTGLAPFRAMIQDELTRHAETPMLLLFGCRSEPDILWREELTELSARHPRFRFVPTLSRADHDWSGRRGRVQEHLRELVEPFAHGGAEIYVCGVGEMVSDCVARLKTELGVSRERIFTERC